MGLRRGASTIAGLAVVSFLGTGCSLIGTDPDPVTAPDPVVAAPVTPSLLGDADLADSALVRLEDLPAGWQLDTAPLAAPPGGPEPVGGCPGLDAEGLHLVPAATSTPGAGSFADAHGNHLATTASVYADVDRAVLAFEALSSPAFMHCLNQVAATELRRQAGTVDVHVVNQPSTTAVAADQAVAYQVQAWATSAGGGVAPMTAEVRFTRIGRGVTMLLGFGMNQPPLELFEHLTKVTAGRLLLGQAA